MQELLALTWSVLLKPNGILDEHDIAIKILNCEVSYYPQIDLENLLFNIHHVRWEIEHIKQEKFIRLDK